MASNETDLTCELKAFLSPSLEDHFTLSSRYIIFIYYQQKCTYDTFVHNCNGNNLQVTAHSGESYTVRL